MINEQIKNVAVIVAHPDDETLWAGGTILNHPNWNCFIICLCRRSDNERASRFYKALKVLKSNGIMGDLDDGPTQIPLKENEVEHAILDLLPTTHFDLIISHNPTGEYTKHRRHEEISRAVITMWKSRLIDAGELWTFAYEDGNKQYFPKPIRNGTIYRILTKKIWHRKYSLITKTFGFEDTSWEAQTTPMAESFWQFTNPDKAVEWLNKLTSGEFDSDSFREVDL